MNQKYQCCFCGLAIEPSPPDVGGLLFSPVIDGAQHEPIEQQLFCHVKCLQARLDPSVKLYVLDVN